MDREIKFRGRNARNGDWVYGYFFVSEGGFDTIITESGGFVKVIAGTKGQYTGLKDKNGTDIYEGDIIRKPYLYDEFYGDNATGYWEWVHEIRVVTYKNGMFCYDGEDFQSITQYPDTEHLKEHYPLPDNFSAGLEVIGNIYENPELIEQ